ncbi:S8 family peptidase, partial [Erythrobacter insulae]
MKSLFINTATAAVAISLASTASASEAQPYVAPELDTMLFAESPSVTASFESDVSASETIAPAVSDEAVPVVLPETIAPISIEAAAVNALGGANIVFDAPEGLLTLPASSMAPSDARVVTTRSIDPRYGDIDAFWGDISPFYGDIGAFWGDISPFYGDISPFWGDISPFYGDIGAFWGDIDAFWGDIVAFDANRLETLGDYWKSAGTQIAATDSVWKKLRYEKDGGVYRLEYDGTPGKIVNELRNLIDQAEAQFGAAYTDQTGVNFRTGFVDEFLARYGIDLDKKFTLAGFSQADRTAFFLDWHDSLNQYSGIDQVDHWMSTVNWTPRVTQIQGSGRQTVIGIIDGSFASDADLGENIVWAGGGQNSVGGHGAGVASLIAGAHDGVGIMGIAPDVNIATYNPFDHNGATSWDEVADGFVALKQIQSSAGDVSVVNLSLGEPGWIFTKGTADFLYRWDVDNYYNDTVFVFAAGNEGVTQNTNIEFNDADQTALIFVGSLGLNGEISSFSNRPGTGCLTDGGACNTNNRLMDRFIVAPGELILVSDGHGGVVRRSGTSFAAPLVSGAISLLHDRWPWLANNPHETTEIIFRSAQDLGAPGVDAVYGHGLLDVTASQAPLDFGNLDFKLYRQIGSYWYGSNYSALSLLSGGVPSWWDTDNVFFTGYENIGDTYRDFSIPMSAFTYGKSTNALGNGYQRLQDFVSDRFANWLLSNGGDRDGDGKHGISQIRSNSAGTDGQWSMRFDAIAPQFSDDGAMRPVHNAATLADPSGTMSFTLGHGQGALALAGNNFGIISDHDHETGGVNPVLGLASGETFAGATYSPLKATTLSVGYSQQREDWRDLDGVSEIERNIQRQLGAREAEALTIGVEQKVTKNLSVNAQYTYLREEDAVLGAQTGSAALLGEGS